MKIAQCGVEIGTNIELRIDLKLNHQTCMIILSFLINYQCQTGLHVDAPHRFIALMPGSPTLEHKTMFAFQSGGGGGLGNEAITFMQADNFKVITCPT